MTDEAINSEPSKEERPHRYAVLWQCARAASAAISQPDNAMPWFYRCSIVLTHAAAEEYISHVWRILLGQWYNRDVSQREVELTQVCWLLGLSSDDESVAQQLRTYAELREFCADVAGKPLSASSRRLGRRPMSGEQQTDQPPEPQFNRWGQKIQTREFAERVYRDVASLLTHIHSARRDDKEPASFQCDASCSHPMAPLSKLSPERDEGEDATCSDAVTLDAREKHFY